MQQINLFKSLQQTPTDWLSTGRMLKIAVSVIVLLLIMSIIGKIQQRLLVSQVEQLQQQQQKVVSTLEEVKILYPDAAKREPFAQQLSQLSAEVSSKVNLLKRFNGDYKVQRFIDYLTALAELDLHDVWLVRIQMQQQGDVRLVGTTEKPINVAQFVQTANQDPQFANQHLEIKQISQNDKQGMVGFKLASKKIVHLSEQRLGRK